ncbi:deoxynucleoside kinase [Enterococcus thailandicus]|uniref:deoxynucleoside kinase n=1 Tax=Enterococcus thailandicus TaxID=417368 RepID=UPI00094DBDD9|nr:deoxynucleoside kinase [Enterococcus thailandicus]
MSVILISGTIGAGKSSLTDMLATEIRSKPFYESVEDNEVLPLFYSNPEQYAFLLQIFFLNKRFLAMKNALINDDNVLDRSIYEDSLLFHLNADLGRVTDIEVQQYDNLLDTMLNELDDVAPKKRPDLMVHIKVSLDTMLSRIKKRGRDYEQLESDETLYNYYQQLNERYDQWYENFDVCPKIQIDGDQFDFVEEPDHAKEVIEQIKQKLVELEKAPTGSYYTDNNLAKGQELG